MDNHQETMLAMATMKMAAGLTPLTLVAQRPLYPQPKPRTVLTASQKRKVKRARKRKMQRKSRRANRK